MTTMKKPLPDPGKTEQTNIKWLACFLSATLDQMTLPELGTVLSDIQAIAKLALSNPSQKFGRWELLTNGISGSSGKPGRVYREWAVRRDLLHYQKVLKRAIGELNERGRTVLHISTSVNVPSLPFEIGKRQSHPFLFVSDGQIDDVFRAFDWRLLFLIQNRADELAVCPRSTCQKVFLKTRTDKEFCSRGCGTIERVRRWRRLRRRKPDGTKRQARSGVATRATKKGRSR